MFDFRLVNSVIMYRTFREFWDTVQNVCLSGCQFYGGPRKEKYQNYNTVLTDLNMAFTIMFLIEMILKLLAFGIRVRTNTVPSKT